MAMEARMDAVEAEQERMREEIRAVQRAPFTNAQLLNALRETQLEHSKKLADHDLRFDEVDSRFDEVDSRFDEVDGRLDALKQGIDTIIDMLTELTEIEVKPDES